MKQIIFTTIITILLTACASTENRLRTLSTQPINGTVIGNQEKVSGKTCRRDILFFINFENTGKLEEAIDEALSKAPGANVLTDVKITKERLFTGFYNYRCIQVEGKALVVK